MQRLKIKPALKQLAGIVIAAMALGIVAFQAAATPTRSAAVAQIAVAQAAVAQMEEVHATFVPAADQLVGVGTCGTTTCHGVPKSRSKVEWRSAYNVWVKRDPHARAYGVLHSQRGQRIVRMLKSPDATDEQFLRQNCTACHSTAQHEADDNPHLRFRDGVTCESCHGAAKDWVSLHTQDDWKNKSEDDRNALGFRDTEMLPVRVQACVNCHVGSPGAEVNHDMIAAGHPRLNFEFHYYMDRLTQLASHWGEKALQDQPADEWLAGREAAQSAALELLGDRAADATVWPEFSEYGCFSCHHDLVADSIRKDRVDPDRGRPVWGSWYFPQPAESGPRQVLRQELRKLTGASREEVQQLAAQIRANAGTGAGGVSGTQQLREIVRTRPAANWDALAQWYLAWWALRDQLIYERKNVDAVRSDLQDGLQRLEQILNFPFDDEHVEFADVESVQDDLIKLLDKLPQ